jgi:hypothetical protein
MWREVIVGVERRCLQAAVGRLEDGLESVARSLVGTEQPERAATVGLSDRARLDVAQQLP